MTIIKSKLARCVALVLPVATFAGVLSCTDSGNGITAPTLLPPISAAAALATGRQHACLLTTTGETWCWGDDTFGSLGDGGTTTPNVPVRVKGAPPFIQISSSDYSVCGLTASAQVWCWGYVPAYPYTVSRLPVKQPAAPTPLVSISVGLYYACGLDAHGAAYCWGSNIVGQLGVGDTLPRVAPTRVAPGTTFTSISATLLSTCGLASGGTAMCWGYNDFYALGTGAPFATQVLPPQPVVGGHIFTSLAAGAVGSCGLTEDGTAYCWGINLFGETGRPPLGTPILAPATAQTDVRFRSFVPGHADSFEQFACGVALDGTGYCSGWNFYGQVGAPSGSTCSPQGLTPNVPCTTVPTIVAGLGPVETISPGGDFTCAITTAKQVVCWGNNAHGELGDGTFTSRATPAAIQGTFAVP